MKRMIPRTLFALSLAAASIAYGGVPPMNVIVSDASGKVAFKGATSASGTFATGAIAPGAYVVQFNSKSADLKGKQFAVVVSAGKKKVAADAVAGEKFGAGGVAMKVDVGSGTKITGQVASAVAVDNKNVKIIKGKRFVYVKEIGSNVGKWVEEGTPEAGNVSRMNQDGVRAMQDRAQEGSGVDPLGR